MTDRDLLHARLETLVADRLRDDPPAPPADVLWRSGSRRRWRSRAGAAGVVAVVLLLILGAFLPLGGVPQAVPATPPGQALPSYPENVAMPFSPRTTSTPGVAALALPGSNGDSAGVWAVGPRGGVAFVPVRDLGPSGPVLLPEEQHAALSPDGHWLATASALRDLTTGRVVGVATDSGRDLGSPQPPVPPSWSPDSRRVVYHPSADPASEGLVVDVATSSTVVVPAAGVGTALVVAGWRDAGTVVGVWRNGADTYLVLTWTVGDESWTNGATVTWPGASSDAELRASVSPDGTQLLLVRRVEAGDGSATEGQVFDTRTGALVGIPVDGVPAADVGWTPDSSLQWEGWGCRPAWRSGVPVVTDGSIRTMAPQPGDELVNLSSAFGADPCAAFAGDELQGRPVSNTAALWAERLRTWGLPVIGLVAVGFVLWWWSRRRGGWNRPLARLPFIYPTAGTGGR
jgi:hypothetical protein